MRPTEGELAAGARKPRRGDRLALAVDALDAKGRGVGSAAGCRVHVRGAVPGATVEVEVTGRRRDEVEARLVGVHVPSPDAAEPRCRYFETCGGCSYQNLAYPAQLAALAARVERAFGRAGLLEGALVEPVAGMDEPWSYRNKMDYTFGARRWRAAGEDPEADATFALGLHVPGVWKKVLDVHACSIAFEGADAIVNTVRREALRLGLEPHDVASHEGLLRHVVLRRGVRTGETMLVLVTSERAPSGVDPLVRGVLAAHPELTTVVQDVTRRKSMVAVGDEQIVLHGPGVVRERLGPHTFTLSPHSFFQTNTVQAERMLEIVREEARLGGDDVLFDLYCGAGTIGIFLADGARSVYGFESVEAAVADARANAAANGVRNAHFVAGDVVDSVAGGAGRPRPDVVVLDPPRAGMHERVTRAVIDLAPRRIVYVSCNPESAARDLRALADGGFRIARIRPIDLFPHTPHVETVVSLDRSP